jgi:predicted dinucleotide-binding enzyme
MSSSIPFRLTRRDMLRLTAGSGLFAAGSELAWAQTGEVKSLKIATIGSGREGGALGTLFAQAGHKVMFSSRHPENLKELAASAGPNASAVTVGDAVKLADVVLLVVPYTAVEQIGKENGAELAKKKLVMDVSNPIPRRDGEEFVKKVNDEGGAGLVSAKLLPGAKIVRAFNAINFDKLAEDAKKSDKVGVPIAGDDKSAIDVAEALIREIGFEPVLVGGLAMGKYLVWGMPPLTGEHSPAELKQIAPTLK